MNQSIKNIFRRPLTKEASAFWLAFGAGAIAASGLLLGYVGAFKLQIDWSFKLVEMLSAIGTVAAVVVALLSTQNSNRRQEMKNLERARLVAAGLSQRLYPALVDLRLALNQIRSVQFDPLAVYTDDVKEILETELQMVRTVASIAVQHSIFRTDVVLAHDLSPLPNDAARNFYEGIASVQAAIDVGWSDGANDFWAAPILYYKFSNIQEVGGLIEAALEKLSAARIEMFNAAKI